MLPAVRDNRRNKQKHVIRTQLYKNNEINKRSETMNNEKSKKT